MGGGAWSGGKGGQEIVAPGVNLAGCTGPRDSTAHAIIPCACVFHDSGKRGIADIHRMVYSWRNHVLSGFAASPRISAGYFIREPAPGSGAHVRSAAARRQP
jgi:hypothetical protein